MPLLRECLERGQTVGYLPFRGVSMLPMLRQGRDSVELSPLPTKLKKYDLPVYQYPSGKYVMHRVVRVHEDHYTCLGDNTYEYETVYPNQMIAVVTAFKRGEKRIQVTSPIYRLYCRVWCASYPFRKFMKKMKRRIREYFQWRIGDGF